VELERTKRSSERKEGKRKELKELKERKGNERKGGQGRGGKKKEGREREGREWRHLPNYNIPEDATDYRTIFSIINRNQQSQTNWWKSIYKLNFICCN